MTEAPRDRPSGEALNDLRRTVDDLLALDGCEWNRAQTHRSLVTYLVEETYELVEAIESGDAVDLREELGDVLYQVVLHAALAERIAGEGFGLDDVAFDADAKTRRRHPHVFGDEDARGVDDILRLWSEAKAVEKADRQSVFDGVPLGLPALARAQKIESRRVENSPDPERQPTDDAELAWGRALLDHVSAATTNGFDAERALRRAVAEREMALRSIESSTRAGL